MRGLVGEVSIISMKTLGSNAEISKSWHKEHSEGNNQTCIWEIYSIRIGIFIG